MKIAIQMDYIESINPKSDSTLLLGIEACRRGYEVFYYTPDKLTYKDGFITAKAYPIQFFDDVSNYYKLGDEFVLDLRTLNVVLLRQDPPFDMNYLSTTYILEMLAPDVLVVNNPASVRNLPEKIFPTIFRQFMPPTLISSDELEIKNFFTEHKDIILKPLYGHGGRAILHLKDGDDNFNPLLEMIFSANREPIIAQKFLPEVRTEDRRIILIDGEVAGVLGRVPEQGEIRANLRVGGIGAKAELTVKQQEICEALRQPLKDNGLIFVGLDVIGDYLTEINITSPTGLRSINKLHGVQLERNIWNAIEAKVKFCV